MTKRQLERLLFWVGYALVIAGVALLSALAIYHLIY